MPIPQLSVCHDLPSTSDSDWDALIVVSQSFSLPEWPEGDKVMAAAIAVDDRVGKDVVLLPSDVAPGGRLVLAPTGDLDRDYDDVRRFSEAAAVGVRRARDAGARKPLLWVPRPPMTEPYEHAVPVALLGALGALWEPLEAREALGEDEVEPVRALGLYASDPAYAEQTVTLVSALEQGRRLARDLGGTEPERMRPEAFAARVEEAFTGSSVKVEVVSSPKQLQREYPLLSAVARASLAVQRHEPRVIRLRYEPEGDVHETLFLAGKGVTYDTGGADLKVGGHMAGMSRDKGGAAAVAGLMKVIEQLRPQGLRVIAEIGAVRNSIGSDSYVADEIVTSHAGVRVRVANTDAEGRMVLADLLSHLREEAVKSTNPWVLSLATLTGHAALTYGPYTAVVENGPARRNRLGQSLSALGDQWGDPVEVSRLRREDFEFVQAKSRAEDVLQGNNASSASTARGHQFPAAFLLRASGLDKHGGQGEPPVPFAHVDIAGSACENDDWQFGRPTAAPVVTLAARWVLAR